MTAGPDDGVKVVFRTPTGEPLTAEQEKVAEVRTRIETLRSALSVVRQIDPALKDVPRVTSELERFDREMGTLDETNPGSALGEMEPRLDAAEDLLMAASARIPFQRLRTRFQNIVLSDVELLGFLTLLERLSTTADYHDRVELFVTRLCRARDRDDGVRPFAEVADLLARFLSTERCSEDTRRQAIEFFAQARERLATLTSIDSIFDSGFYIDLKGYKIALRSDYFDPEVLHAAATLSIAFEAKIRSLLAADSQSGQGLDGRFDGTRDTVRAVFGEKIPEFRDGLTARIRQRRPSIDPETIAREEPPPPRAKRTARTRIVLGVLVIGLVAGAVSFHQIWQVRQRDMSEIAGAKLGTLSPLLVSGSYGGAEDARVFVGKVDPSRWDALSKPERHQHLRELARNLGDVASALVYRDDVLVGQIVNGNVRFQE